MHDSYLHIVGNMIFAIFIMYEMEYSSKISIFLGLLAGILANCFAIFTLEGKLLGFSGVLASYVGMIMSIIFTHCTYLQNRFQMVFCYIVFMMVILTFMILGFGLSFLIHLYGYLLGLLLGAGFLPKHMDTDVTGVCDKILKGAGIVVSIAILTVAIIV